MGQQVSAPAATPLPQVLARGPVETATLLGWGSQVAHALSGVHALGLAHGDLRAEAVEIDAAGDAAVTARRGGDVGEVSPAYPAPELAAGGTATPASDVYALGALLHAAGADRDPGLTGVWQWMGDPDPARRPSATDVADHLRRLADDAGPPGVQPPPLTSMGVTTFDPFITSPRPTGSRRPPWVAATAGALALALGLAGGLWLLISPPVPGDSTSTPAALGADPIGDVRTADPCSILDEKPLQRFGTTRLVPDMDIPSGCSVQLGVAGSVSWVSGWLSEPYPDERDLSTYTAHTAGRTTVYRKPAAAGCGRVLVLPDRYRVFLDIYNNATNSLDVCAMGDTAEATALKALSSPALPRRALDASPGSLTGLHTCDLNVASALPQVPGLDPTKRRQAYGGWSCTYGYDAGLTNPPYAMLQVLRTTAPAGPSQVIGGRTAWVMPTGGPALSNCEVYLVQRRFNGIFGEARVEVLDVLVHTSNVGNPDQQCTAATAIAQAASTSLPTPA